MPLDAPLNGLGKALLGGLLALGEAMGATVPDVPPDAVITGAEAIAIKALAALNGAEGLDIVHAATGDLFPRMAPIVYAVRKIWRGDDGPDPVDPAPAAVGLRRIPLADGRGGHCRHGADPSPPRRPSPGATLGAPHPRRTAASQC